MAAANSKSLLRVYEKAEGIFQRLAALVVSFTEVSKALSSGFTDSLGSVGK